MSNPLARPARALAAGVILLALAASGCAYYNTFYLAKRYYNEGQKAQEKSTTDAPTPEAVAKYDAAVRQCNKVLTDYSDSKWADDAAYLLGASLYGKGEYRDALKQVQTFREKYPKSPFLSQAQFIEGLAHYRMKDYPQADSILHAVDSTYAKFPKRWALCYYAGESRAAEKDYRGAVWWYERASEVGERHQDRAAAFRRMGDALIAADRPDTAAVVYDRALREEERPTQRFEIMLLRGDALRDMKHYQEALDLFRDWRALAPAEKREGDLELRINECLSLLGRAQEALAGYKDLVERYPHTNVGYEAQFQIGYLYETVLNDLDAAGREYDKLKSEPPSSFASQAVRRAQNLVTLRDYRQKLESDTTQARSRAAFMVAELTYFQLGDVDSAFHQYDFVERDFPTSPYAPKAGYARLWIATHDHNDTTQAAALTDSVVRRYRGSQYVDNALNLWKHWSGRTDARTALLDSLLAHPDTSTVALYREQPEPPAPKDSTKAPPPPPKLTPEQLKARSDSLEAVRVKMLDEGMAPHRTRKDRAPEGKKAPKGQVQPPAPQPPQQAQPPAPQPTQQPAQPPAQQQQQPDTTRVGNAPAQAPAPADSARAAPPPAPPAAADTSQTGRSAPPDTTTPPVVTPAR